MNLDIQKQNSIIDQMPAPISASLEVAPNLSNHESSLAISVEKEGRNIEAASSVNTGAITLLSTPISDNNAGSVATKIVGAPLIAKDDDLIEKEWVEKAKKIVAQTKDNPHQREEAATGLKVDYLKKRFGRELGEAE